MDWTKLGHALRESADDAHDGATPHVDIAYSFLCDNPECFEVNPDTLPAEPPIELIAAYYGAP